MQVTRYKYMLETSENYIVQALIIIESLFFLASRFHMALSLSERFWCKPQNCQLVSKSPIFKMAENHHGTHFHKWGRNSNAYNLNIVGKKILSGSILRQNHSPKMNIFRVIDRKSQGQVLKTCRLFLKKNRKDMKKCLNKITAIV